MSPYIVGLGSNLGSRDALLRAGLELLGDTSGIELGPVSKAYVTEALEGRGPPFVNAAARVDTDVGPHALLARMLEVERALGRERSGHWAPRTLDLDLLWGPEAVADPPRLRLPHPALTQRSFALGPLLDVAPELGDRYAGALEALGGRPPGARPLGEPGGFDAWDRRAAELTRVARSARSGPLAPAREVRTIEGLDPFREGDSRELDRRVGELARSAWRVRRVALGPARGGTVPVYLVGAPPGPELPE